MQLCTHSGKEKKKKILGITIDSSQKDANLDVGLEESAVATLGMMG